MCVVPIVALALVQTAGSAEPRADGAHGVVAASTTTQAADPAPAHPELRAVFEAFGGKPGLDALMEDFMVLLLADEQLNPFFAYVDQAAVKKHLADQFCVILGGDCTYTGRDMREAHALFEIREAEFNRLVELLQAAMERRGVPFAAQNRLLAVLAPMQRDVVNK
ncbi:group I truncated hemoglobin [Chiayiivirga flava]|uniref:Hemoglobin n=1 Tax=Chiayiivirga flava TaxID=659595 RepID=A0A7W8D550_9GAMM|nr:group 1 truncated hemoglobin [Chiayiivirga flava]MBB5208108.1 hemoglobin [Chiayiivirga flava]